MASIFFNGSMNGSQTYRHLMEVLQAQCVCRTTDGCVTAGRRAGRAVKSISW